ncbi:MAG: hypothetical protein K6U74_02675 [Firmicutes bacterium]|nr:hypothetical protein [Bacillota bacterium]
MPGTPQAAEGVSAVVVPGKNQGRTTQMSASTERETGQVKLKQENDQNIFISIGLS